MKNRFDRKRILQLRSLPLPPILLCLSAQQDRYDKSKWETTQGSLTITGSKFYNWNSGIGGGGAIDLVLHLQQCQFMDALNWLEEHLRTSNDTRDIQMRPNISSRLVLPESDPTQLWKVRSYLSRKRHIQPVFIETHIENGTLYADARANAVFLLQTLDANPAGAELRGTSTAVWRGMAPGTRKDHGYFSTPLSAEDHWPIILCESAIDAISCHAIHPRHRCISTAGARADPAWLQTLLDIGRTVYCGFDTDFTGEHAARAMMTLYPAVKRVRPFGHDWNDDLCSKKLLGKEEGGTHHRIKSTSN